MKTKRNLSGIYSRAKNDELGKEENTVFEDLSEDQQDNAMSTWTIDSIKSLAKKLADTINSLGEKFDIMCD